MALLDKISILDNPVQEYAWGSKTLIQDLLGLSISSGKPMAELWMGAHPGAPSRVSIDGEWKALPEVIANDPDLILGKDAARRYSGKLPFLFKVLAADRPLSVQVHPDKFQAREGFSRESELGIPLNSPERSFRDENHKPEILCALTPFQALKGFRDINDILMLMEKVRSPIVSDEMDRFIRNPGISGLKRFYTSLMTMDREAQHKAVENAVGLARKFADKDREFHWMVELDQEYPGDIGVFSPLILNLVQIEPGEAIYLPPGKPHAYLHGAGMELMASSDNVIRGGLTPKKVDVPELLRAVRFETDDARLINPVTLSSNERIYSAPAEEFRLSEISTTEGNHFTSPESRNVEIMICIRGEADITDLGSGESLKIKKGTSVIVPSIVSRYLIKGISTIYKASVPGLSPALF
ncbi:MAG: mannose-6-phosphate isomerase, class I [Deltaproteobacteria bacterium]|nr:mannose-6-phosphate isomerase, class I [Deltaproteobacteria bacterium]